MTSKCLFKIEYINAVNPNILDFLFKSIFLSLFNINNAIYCYIVFTLKLPDLQATIKGDSPNLSSSSKLMV